MPRETNPLQGAFAGVHPASLTLQQLAAAEVVDCHENALATANRGSTCLASAQTDKLTAPLSTRWSYRKMFSPSNARDSECREGLIRPASVQPKPLRWSITNPRLQHHIDPGHQRCRVAMRIAASRYRQWRKNGKPEARAVEPFDPRR